MSKRYPCTSGSRRVKNGLCKCCGAKAVEAVTIQVSWFRGDDEVLQVCGQCATLKRDPDKLLRLCDEFRGAPK